MKCDYLSWPIDRRYGVPQHKDDDLKVGTKDLTGTYSSIGVLLRHNFEKLKADQIGMPHFLNVVNRVRRMIADENNAKYEGDYTVDDPVDKANKFLGNYMAPPIKELLTHKKGGLTRIQYESEDPTHGKYAHWSQDEGEYLEQKERSKRKKEETSERRMGTPGEDVRFFYFPLDPKDETAAASDEDAGASSDGEATNKRKRKSLNDATVWKVSPSAVLKSGFFNTPKYCSIHEDGEGGGLKIAFHMGNRINKTAMRKFYGVLSKEESKEVQKLKQNVLIMCYKSPMDLGETLPLKEEFEINLPNNKPTAPPSTPAPAPSKKKAEEDQLPVQTPAKKRTKKNNNND